MSQAKSAFSRILVKLSGEALMGGGDYGIDPAVIKRIAGELQDIRAMRVHPAQRLAAASDGRVRLSVSVPSLEEVTRWVLGFGSAARVIEPIELRDAVVRELRSGLTRYGR